MRGVNLVSMSTDTGLTLGDVARELGLDIGQALDLVYAGDLAGRPDPTSGRIYVTVKALGIIAPRIPSRQTNERDV